LTRTRGCAACSADNGLAARFCRRCGAALLSLEGPGAPLEPTNEAEESEKPAAVDGQRIFVELCWLCGSLIAISVLLAIWVRLGTGVTEPELMAIGATALVALAGAIMNWQMLGSALRLPTISGVGDTLIVAVITAPTLLLGFWVIEGLGFPMYSGYLAHYVREGWPIWVGFVAIAVVTPISEELLFRGLIQPKLEQLVSSREALIVQAAIFSALHLSALILVTHFVMGLAFGWTRRRTGSVFPGMLLHSAWNAWVLWSALSVSKA
jgi:membrane protease YdiL (CAAX protease family)